MEYCNYTLFEILKYKIELLDCLEYCMESYELNIKEIEKNLSYLKNNLESGMYKEIITSLFTEYDKVNQDIFSFFSNYSLKKIKRMIKSKKAKHKINYIKNIIDCHESLNQILLSFIKEEELLKKFDKKLTKLFETHNTHFINFLYFITYSMYSCYLYPNKSKLKFTDEDIKDLVSIIKYCNKDNLFENSIKILKDNIEGNINNEFERLSNKCIETENKQAIELKEIISLLNQELQKNKKS
jgi:hypothetical protein